MNRHKQAQKRKVYSVYVLQLEKGYIYVGKSTNVKNRLEMHKTGRGAAFTKLFKPTGKVLPRIGSLQGDGDGPERDETLRQMMKHGPDKVRGWKYVSKNLTSTDRAEIEANLRELYDLCRRCGRKGHFAAACHHKDDRYGNAIVNAKKINAIVNAKKINAIVNAKKINAIVNAKKINAIVSDTKQNGRSLTKRSKVLEKGV